MSNTDNPLIAFRSHKLDDLTSLQVKLIMEKGMKLFDLMKITPDARKYLEFNPELDEAIKLW